MKTQLKSKIPAVVLEFSSEFDAISTTENEDQFFSQSGCDCCNGKATMVQEITALLRKDIAAENYENIHEFSVCGTCLCFLVNGDDGDLIWDV